jgi:hypothetical protein
MPLGVHVGGTATSSRGPVGDITLRFEWPFFLSRFDSGVTADIWQITVAASFYMDAR